MKNLNDMVTVYRGLDTLRTELESDQGVPGHVQGAEVREDQDF